MAESPMWDCRVFFPILGKLEDVWPLVKWS